MNEGHVPVELALRAITTRPNATESAVGAWSEEIGAPTGASKRDSRRAQGHPSLAGVQANYDHSATTAGPPNDRLHPADPVPPIMNTIPNRAPPQTSSTATVPRPREPRPSRAATPQHITPRVAPATTQPDTSPSPPACRCGTAGAASSPRTSSRHAARHPAGR